MITSALISQGIGLHNTGYKYEPQRDLKLVELVSKTFNSIKITKTGALARLRMK